MTICNCKAPSTVVTQSEKEEIESQRSIFFFLNRSGVYLAIDVFVIMRYNCKTTAAKRSQRHLGQIKFLSACL